MDSWSWELKKIHLLTEEGSDINELLKSAQRGKLACERVAFHCTVFIERCLEMQIAVSIKPMVPTSNQLSANWRNPEKKKDEKCRSLGAKWITGAQDPPLSADTSFSVKPLCLENEFDVNCWSKSPFFYDRQLIRTCAYIYVYSADLLSCHFNPECCKLLFIPHQELSGNRDI